MSWSIIVTFHGRFFCLFVVKLVFSGHSKEDRKCRSKVLQNAPSEYSAIRSTFIKLPFVFKTFVMSIFEWPLKTGFTVYKARKLNKLSHAKLKLI